VRTLYDDVVDRLTSLAAREGMSVSSFAVKELAESSRRANNRALLDGFADHDVPAGEVVGDLEAGRSAR